MARTALFGSLRRLLAAAHASNRSGRPAAEILAAARTGPRRRDVLAGAAAGVALLPLIGCGDNVSEIQTPVAVIGGGIAGLHCAYQLQKSGVDVTVFEASDRTGGRMYTARDKFPDSQLCELGGELVDTAHTTIQGLAADFGLTLDNLPMATQGLASETFYFDGALVDEATIVTQFTPLAAQMATSVTAAEANDTEFARVDAMSIPMWLETEAGLPSDSLIRRILELAYLGEYGLEVDQQSVFNLLYLIDYGTPDPFHIFGDSDEVYHVHEGNDAIPAALAAALGDRIKLGHTLLGVSQRPEGTFVVELQTADGVVTTVAEHVVFALPFTRLRQCDLSKVDLPPEKVDVIQHLGYGSNAKLMLGFSEKVWATQHQAGGYVFTDVGALQSGWDSSRGQTGTHGIWTNFVGGDRGVAIGAGTAEDRAAEVVPWLDTLYPGATAAYDAQSALRMHWPTQPQVLASYACYKPGQTSFSGTEGARVGNLHFCGEHTSVDFQGYMEGGAETGAMVALEILDDLHITPTPRLAELLAPKLRRPQPCYHAGRFAGGPVPRSQRKRL